MKTYSKDAGFIPSLTAYLNIQRNMKNKIINNINVIPMYIYIIYNIFMALMPLYMFVSLKNHKF